jgi:hypothetical protein
VNFGARLSRKPFQPVKLLSLLDTLHVLSPSLRFCISGFHNQKSSYHISARFASAEADFMAIFRFLLVFSAGIWYAERNVLLEGGCTHMGWNGCVFFKKGNP